MPLTYSYLTQEQADNLLDAISAAFLADAQANEYTQAQATQRWDALFKIHAQPFGIGYGVMQETMGFKGTYIENIQPFRELRQQQITSAHQIYVDAQAAAQQAADAAAQAVAEAAAAAKNAKLDKAQAKRVKQEERAIKAAEQGPRTLKKMQMHIKEYIREIKEIQKKIKDSENYTTISEDFWKAKIKELEALNKKLANPESSEAKKIMANVELVKDFGSVAYLHEFLIKDLTKFVANYEENVENENAAEKEKIRSQLKEIKNNVAEFFLLTKKKLKVPKKGESLLEAKTPKVKDYAPNSTKGAAFLLSRIAGTPKHALSSKDNEGFKKSIQKDIKKISELYAKEISSLNFKEKAQKDAKKHVLGQLRAMELDSKEVYNLKSQDELNDLVFMKIDIESIIPSEEDQDTLSEKISRKFKEMSAPSSHQNLIKQINQSIDKLTKKLSKLEDGDAKNKVTADLEYTKKLHTYLIDSDPTKLHKKVEEIRSRQNDIDDADKKGELNLLIEAVLKAADPYYNEIKELDKYIANLEKDLKKHPQEEGVIIDTKKESNRTVKLETARYVRTLLLHPKDNLTTKKIEDAITKNTQYTKTVIGKGNLDGILNSILDKVEPGYKNKKKMKP